MCLDKGCGYFLCISEDFKCLDFLFIINLDLVLLYFATDISNEETIYYDHLGSQQNAVCDAKTNGE